MSKNKTKVTNKGIISEKIADTDTPTFSVEINGGPGFTSKTRARMDLYVNETSGSDDNSGAFVSPFKTLEKAINLIPDVVEHPIFIHLTSGSYNMPAFSGHLARESIYIVGDGDNNDGSLSVLQFEQGVATGGTDDEVVVSGKLGSNQEHRARFVEILSGDAAGDRRVIATHTDTSLIPSLEFSAAIQPGDTFRIFEPAATVFFPNKVVSYAEPIISPRYGTTTPTFQNSLCFVNVGMNNNSTDFVFGGLIQFYGLFFRKNGFPSLSSFFPAGAIQIGVDNGGTGSNDLDVYANIGNEIFNAPSRTSWRAWGLGAPNINAFPIWNRVQANIVGLVIDRVPSSNSRMWIQGFEIYNGGVRAFGPELDSAETNIIHLNNGWTDISAERHSQIVGNLGWGVLIEQGALVTLTKTIISSSAEGIECEGGKCIYAQGEITGSTIGILAKEGGVVKFNQSGISITATTAETRVEDPNASDTDQTLSSYSSVGSYIASGDGTKIQRYL